MWGASLFLMLLNFSAYAQWVQTNGPSVGRVYALVAYGAKLFAGTDGGGIFLSPDNGGNWSAANSGVTDLYITALMASDTNLFAGGIGEGVFRSTDSGSTWTGAGLRGYCAIFAFAVNDTYLFAGGSFNEYGGSGGAYRSANYGGSWTQIRSGLGFGLNSRETKAFVVNGLQILAGIEYGGVFSSTDNGLHWIENDSGLTNNRVVALFKNGTNLFAGTRYGGIFRSTDNSATWTPVNSGLTNMGVFSFAASGAKLFAGTGNGVFLSTDSGANWTVPTGLPANTWVQALTVLGNNLFAATWGYGVWRLPLSETFVQKPRNTSLTQFNFKLNSPNRFNHILSFEFSLLRPEQVTVQIIDLSGHQIAALVNKHLGTGAHHVSWDTRNMAPGGYILSFSAGGIKIDRKVLIVR